MQSVKKAVIPVAGFGTRFLPATKAVPKEMLPIVDVPALQYIVSEAVDSGISDILIVISRGKEAVMNHFDVSFELEDHLREVGNGSALRMVQQISKMANIHYVRQPQMLGSGVAVGLAREFVGNEPFAVLYGDDVMFTGSSAPVTKQLIDAYETTATSILGVQKMSDEVTRTCCAVVPGKIKGKFIEVRGLIEKPQGELPSNYTGLGRYVLTPDIFEIIDHTQKAKNGEVYLTDAIATLAKQVGVYAYDFDAVRYDIGDKLGFLKATVEYALRDGKLGKPFADYLYGLMKGEKNE